MIPSLSMTNLICGSHDHELCKLGMHQSENCNLLNERKENIHHSEVSSP
jgi:hypothetical protein